jgi:ribosomal protein S24E
MVIDQLMSLRTDAALLEVMKAAASRKLSARENIEQRVSYVFGLMHDDSTVTREHVRKVILEQVGATEEAVAS